MEVFCDKVLKKIERMKEMIVSPQVDLEFKALMPPLSTEEYDRLQQNILADRKCHDAVLLWNGFIVDGFNRFCICVEHGIEFKVEELHFDSKDDAKIWIINHQLGRRNLCDAARIELALCRVEMLKNAARKNLARAGSKRVGEPLTKTSDFTKINVKEAIAKEAGVGIGTLQRYMQVKENAKLLEKLQDGEMKIGTAHRMLGTELEKRLRKADKMYAYIKQRLPFDNEDINKQVYGKLEQLGMQLESLIAKLKGVYHEQVEDKTRV